MELWALDGFDQLGPIVTATKVQVVERDLAEGGWLVEMPLGDAGEPGAALLAATFPGIELHDPDTGWRFGGYQTSATVILDEEGGETLRLAGKDFQSDLAAWTEWPDPETPDGWWKTVYAAGDTLTGSAFTAVELHAGPSAAVGRPQINGLVYGFTLDSGTPKRRRAKGEPLLDVMRFLFGDSTEFTARLRMIRLDDGSGAVEFDTPARQLSPIVLDVKRGTFGRVEVTTTAADATWVLGMGAEIEPVVTPGERLIRIASTLAQFDWRYRYRERVINRPATDDANALGDEVSAVQLDPDSWWRRTVKVDEARVEGWGRDIDLGWMVDVQLGPTFTPSTVRLPVVASTLTFTPAGGWVRTIDVGTESLEGPAALYASIGRTRAALRQVEADSR